MDYTPQTPRIVGTTEIPAKKTVRTPKGKRGPGRYWLHGGERSAFARRVIDSLTPGKATVLEFDDAETLQRYMLVLHNVNRCTKTHPHTPVRTRSLGLRLVVWLRDDTAQLPLL